MRLRQRRLRAFLLQTRQIHPAQLARAQQKRRSRATFQTTLALRNASISTALNPNNRCNTASVCSPSNGGA